MREKFTGLRDSPCAGRIGEKLVAYIGAVAGIQSTPGWTIRGITSGAPAARPASFQSYDPPNPDPRVHRARVRRSTGTSCRRLRAAGGAYAVSIARPRSAEATGGDKHRT